MKKAIILIVLISAGIILYNMNPAPSWNTNFEKAKEESRESGKQMLLYFSGSDWCGVCMKMKKDILETEVFQKFAEEKLILILADFPRQKKNKPDEKTMKQNETLAEKYNPSGVFPYTVLLNAEGKVIKQWQGYPNVKVEEFIDQIRKCQ